MCRTTRTIGTPTRRQSCSTRLFEGRPRKLLVQANRNGFYYILDRTTGEFLLAEPFVKELNWATGIDAKGRPIVAPNTDPTPAGVRVCPTVHGATNWWSPSLNPELGLFYVVALEQCETYYSSAQPPAPNSGFRGTGHTLIAGEKGQFYLRALDMKTGKLRWEFPMPGPTLMWAGTLSTAGGLVFSADDDGDLVGLDAKSRQGALAFLYGQQSEGVSDDVRRRRQAVRHDRLRQESVHVRVSGLKIVSSCLTG